MVLIKKEKPVFKCREVTCSKPFTFRQNRQKQEKRFNNMPITTRSPTLLPLYNTDLKTYCSYILTAYIESDKVYQPFVNRQEFNLHERIIFHHYVTLMKTLLLVTMISLFLKHFVR